jgi:2,3-bisphosphoglycerate-dependent phosphoglycerate mutase
MSVNIPTGVPLVYTFDDNFNVVDKQFLIDQNSLNSKLNAIAKQGRVERKK